MGVAFNTITTGIRTPTNHTEADGSRAVSGITPTIPNKILLTGIKLAAGSVAELVAKPVLSVAQAEDYWGVGSQIADMLRIAKLNNATTEMWGIGIDELSGGTAGTTTLTVTGTVTTAGTIALYIGGVYIAIAVAVGDDATAIALAIDTQLKASTKYSRIAFTSGTATNVTTLTMKWNGVEQPDVRFNYLPTDAFPAGITSIVVAEGTPGAGNPDVSEVITVMGDEPYQTVVMPWGDATNLGLLETEMERRFGGMVQAEGVAFGGFTGTHAATTTQGNSRNSKHLCIMGGNESPAPSWHWATATAVVDAFEPDPARPRTTLQLKGIVPAPLSAKWSRAQQDLLLHDGIATHDVDSSNTVYIQRLVTTYETNPQSIDDPTWLDVCTHRTMDYVRYSRRTQISLDFPRHKAMGPANSNMAEEEVPPGQPIVTAHILKNHGLAQFRDWQEAGIVEDADQFAAEYIVFRDPADQNRFQEQLGPNFVNQFRGAASQFQFLI